MLRKQNSTFETAFISEAGIAYPNSDNATKDFACSPAHMQGPVIEFAGHKLDFKIVNYTMKVIVADE